MVMINTVNMFHLKSLYEIKILDEIVLHITW